MAVCGRCGAVKLTERPCSECGHGGEQARGRQAGHNMSAQVQGQCPNGCGKTLFLGSGGYVTCNWQKCPDPGSASDLLARSVAIQSMMALSTTESTNVYARSRMGETPDGALHGKEPRDA